MADADFDLDDEPVLTAEGEVAAAICGHQVVMQRGDALTADMLDEFHSFVQEELAALLDQLPINYEMTINLKTAKSLGLDVHWQLQQLANEVIE